MTDTKQLTGTEIAALETNCHSVTLASKSLKTRHIKTVFDARSLAVRDGGYREKRKQVRYIELSDGSTNLANAYDVDGDFLFAFAVDDYGVSSICG